MLRMAAVEGAEGVRAMKAYFDSRRVEVDRQSQD